MSENNFENLVWSIVVMLLILSVGGVAFNGCNQTTSATIEREKRKIVCYESLAKAELEPAERILATQACGAY